MLVNDTGQKREIMQNQKNVIVSAETRVLLEQSSKMKWSLSALDGLGLGSLVFKGYCAASSIQCIQEKMSLSGKKCNVVTRASSQALHARSSSVLSEVWEG